MSNTFFQGGENFSRGGLAPLVTGLVGTVRPFNWLVSSIFKLNQILAMALWNCFCENTCS